MADGTVPQQVPAGPAGTGPVGRIVQVSISNGGAPKFPVAAATVGPLGLEGDRHTSPRHGGPDRAVMLYSMEQIARLRAEGHPIGPGGVGENVTTEGIDLGRLSSGDRLQLGDAVVVEITGYATPCAGIAAAFRKGDFTLVWEERHPGMGRRATRVLAGGRIRPGDPVRLLPRAHDPAP